MWLQTGDEKQWLQFEHDRIAAQARADHRDAAVTATVRLGRVLRAVLIPGFAIARIEYTATPDHLLTHQGPARG